MSEESEICEEMGVPTMIKVDVVVVNEKVLEQPAAELRHHGTVITHGGSNISETVNMG